MGFWGFGVLGFWGTKIQNNVQVQFKSTEAETQKIREGDTFRFLQRENQTIMNPVKELDELYAKDFKVT